MRVDSPLLVTTLASAYAPLDGGGGGVVVLEVVLVVVVLAVLVVVVEGPVVVVVVVAGGPMTVATGAHHPPNASPHVTATFPVPAAALWPCGLVDIIEPEGLMVAHRRTNPVA